MLAHYYFASESIDMLLLDRNWLGKDVKTCTHEININYFMISHDTVNTLVVIAATKRCEIDLYANKRLRFNNTFSLGETKHVVAISDKLKTYRQVRMVVDTEKTICTTGVLYFSELD